VRRHFEFDRIREAYLRMARDAKFRPAAPGDGFGTVLLSDEQAKDEARLEAEATKYATEFIEEENTRKFNIGVSNGVTNRAFAYTIEAARLLCGMGDSALYAKKLLQFAIDDIERAENAGELSPNRPFGQ